MTIVQPPDEKCNHPWQSTLTQIDDDGDYVVCTVCCDRLTKEDIRNSKLDELARLAHIVEQMPPAEFGVPYTPERREIQTQIARLMHDTWRPTYYPELRGQPC